MACECKGTSRATVESTPLPDGKAERLLLCDLRETIFRSLNSLLPSTYSDEAASTNYNIHLRALAGEFAKVRRLFDIAKDNLATTTSNRRYLYQNFGKRLGYPPSDLLTAEEYRESLQMLLYIIANGSKVPTFQTAIEGVSPYDIQITEGFEVIRRVEGDVRRSFLNGFNGGLLNAPEGDCGGSFQLNSGSSVSETFLWDFNHRLWVIDALILDQSPFVFIDKAGKISDILEITRPKDTCVSVRNVVSDSYQVLGSAEDGDTRIIIGELGYTGGTGLNIPENTLNVPNPLPFILNQSPEYTFTVDLDVTI